MPTEDLTSLPTPAFAGGTGALTTTPVVGSPPREYPDVFGPQEALVAFLALLEDVRTRKAEERKSRVLATMACKTAIKAGERLPREKMEFLVRELFRTSNPAVCPHGRPIVVRLDRAAFERGLGRR